MRGTRNSPSMIGGVQSSGLPRVVQSAGYCGGGPASFTLAVAPRVGNWLVAIMTRYDQSGVSTASGWTALLTAGSSAVDDYINVYARPVRAADTKAIAAAYTGGTNRGVSAVLYEIEHMPAWFGASQAQLAYAARGETASASCTLNGERITPRGLLLGMFASSGSSALPSIGTDVADQELSGISSNASPRAITTFHRQIAPDDSMMATAAWPVSLNNYALMLCIPYG